MTASRNAALTPACSSARKPDAVVPLEVGNYWLYHRWYSVPTIADTIREEVLSRHEFSIEGESHTIYGYQRMFHRSGNDVPENGAGYSLARGVNDVYPLSWMARPSIDYQWLRANGTDGLYSFGGISAADTLLLRNIHYKHPDHVGESWEYSTIAYHFRDQQFSVGDTIDIEVVGMNEDFETDFGHFKDCYVYRFSEISWDPVYHWNHFVYIKPGIGIVGVETRRMHEPEDLIGQWILIDHHIN
jgi:hypothetical protein